MALCHRTDSKYGDEATFGLTHLAFSSALKEAADAFYYAIEGKVFPSVNAPRTTEDGYYEAVIFDPESNQLERTI